MKFSNKNLLRKNVEEKDNFTEEMKAAISLTTNKNASQALHRLNNQKKEKKFLAAGLDVDFVLPDNTVLSGRIAKVLDDSALVIHKESTYKIPEKNIHVSQDALDKFHTEEFAQNRFRVVRPLTFNSDIGYYTASVKSFYPLCDKDIYRYASTTFEGFDVKDAINDNGVTVLILEKSAKKVQDDINASVVNVLKKLSSYNPGINFVMKRDAKADEDKITSTYYLLDDNHSQIYIKNGFLTKEITNCIAKGTLEIDEDGFSVNLSNLPLHNFGLTAEDLSDVDCSLEYSSEDRCWEGYEPVPGKKPYEDGSCKKKEGGDEHVPEHDEALEVKENDDKHYSYDASLFEETESLEPLTFSSSKKKHFSELINEAVYPHVSKIVKSGGSLSQFATHVAVLSLIDTSSKKLEKIAVDQVAEEYLKKYLGDLGEYYSKIKSAQSIGETASTALEQAKFFRKMDQSINSILMKQLRSDKDYFRDIIRSLDDGIKHDILSDAMDDDTVRSKVERQVKRNLNEQETGFQNTWRDAPSRALEWVKDRFRDEEDKDIALDERRLRTKDKMQRFNDKLKNEMRQVEKDISNVKRKYNSTPKGSQRYRRLQRELSRLEKEKSRLNKQFDEETHNDDYDWWWLNDEEASPQEDIKEETSPRIDKQVIEHLKKKYQDIDVEDLISPHSAKGVFKDLSQSEQLQKAIEIIENSRSEENEKQEVV